MTLLIIKLKGMTVELEAKLKAQGIHNSDQFLEAAQEHSGRKGLAEKVGAELGVILGLANRADLARIHGIGGVFSNLLEHAGVDTVKELATRRPDNLHAKLQEINSQRELAGRTPNLNMVQDWVAQAKDLPTLLKY